jgi:hypothetical protein
MAENLEGTWGYDHPGEDEASGIRTNPWLSRLHAQGGERGLRRGGLDDGLVADVGARVLARFDSLTRADHAGVVEVAIERLSRDPAPLTEGRAAHAVLAAAIARDLRRWAGEIDAPPQEIARELARAGERAAALSGRERSVFFAVCALDDVALEAEVGQVVLRAAVAHQMRWNTAHQNLSRAWRKICEGGPLGDWCGDWRMGHRFVCGAPPFALWDAARAYMDGCSGRGDHEGEAFAAWVEAHEAHHAWFNEWKRQSTRATRRWRELSAALDASGVRPGALHASLVRGCAALGIDRWVVPAKLGQQSWRELLDPAHRPPPAARASWPAFLREGRFGPEVEAAFRALERDAALVDIAGVELESAYARLLAAAERQSSATLGSRNAFRALVDAITVSDGALIGDDAGEAR